MLPADGMESIHIFDARKENLNDCEEKSYLNQKQSQEVPNKPLTQGYMKQNVVKVQPGVNISKSNSNNDPATHRTLYSGNMDYKGESRDETPFKAEHLEKEHDETGKNVIISGFGQNNPAEPKKIKSKDSQTNSDKQTTKSTQSPNIHQEKNNPTERRSVFDRLGKQKEEPAHYRQSNPRKNTRHSGHKNVSYIM